MRDEKRMQTPFAVKLCPNRAKGKEYHAGGGALIELPDPLPWTSLETCLHKQ